MILPVKNCPKGSDGELLAAIGTGDRHALEELYLGYHPRLARFLSRFTPRYENVEEIINDTFMVVWQRAKDFRCASLVSTWIFGIAYRTALKSLRRQKNHSAARSLEGFPEQTGALVAALDAHAQVVNLSLAGPEDPLLTGLIREGLRRGILFVGAASSPTADGRRPTADGRPGLLHEAGVIEVRSSEAPPAGGFALNAPGREIVTLVPGAHYDFASGDSMATAQVTGVVALLLEKNHALTTAAAVRLLRDTSAPADAAHGDAGHVDACAAIVALMGRGTCRDADPDSRLAEMRGGLGGLH